MDSSLYKIVKVLIENGPTTTDELAYLEDVGNRTIENRIKDLSSVLQDTATIKKYGNTYSLVIHKYGDFLKIETSFFRGELDLNDPTIRKNSIINSLLKESDYVSIDQISDEIGLDKRVINHTLNDLKDHLKLYTATVDNKRGKGLKLNFNNEAFALLLLRNIYQSNRQYIDAENFKSNKNMLSDLSLEKGLVSQIALNMTVLMQWRKKHEKITDYISEFNSLWDVKNKKIIELKEVFSNIFVDLTDSEVTFLLSPLNLSKNQYLDNNLVDKYFKENEKFIHGSLEKSIVNYGLKTDVVYDRIKWHVLFLINRGILREKTNEVLPKDISEKYPVAFEFALSLTKIIENKFNIKININEINYLVLYFETAIENLTEKNKDNTLRLALIGKYRSSVKDFIVGQFKDILPNCEVNSFKTAEEIDTDKKYLFILSQHPFKYKNVPVVNTNILFRKDALSIVIAIALIQEYIEEGKATIIRYDLFNTSYYELVQELVNNLVDDQELLPDFYEKWTKREKKSNNVISNGIAIPHAVDSSGKKRVLLSFGIVKEKAVYNKTRLKLVFLIGIPADLDDSLVEVISRVYDLISMISRNQVLFENAENYDNHQPFIQMLEGI